MRSSSLAKFHLFPTETVFCRWAGDRQSTCSFLQTGITFLSSYQANFLKKYKVWWGKPTFASPKGTVRVHCRCAWKLFELVWCCLLECMRDVVVVISVLYRTVVPGTVWTFGYYVWRARRSSEALTIFTSCRTLASRWCRQLVGFGKELRRCSVMATSITLLFKRFDTMKKSLCG